MQSPRTWLPAPVRRAHASLPFSVQHLPKAGGRGGGGGQLRTPSPTALVNRTRAFWKARWNLEARAAHRPAEKMERPLRGSRAGRSVRSPLVARCPPGSARRLPRRPGQRQGAPPSRAVPAPAARTRGGALGGARRGKNPGRAARPSVCGRVAAGRWPGRACPGGRLCGATRTSPALIAAVDGTAAAAPGRAAVPRSLRHGCDHAPRAGLLRTRAGVFTPGPRQGKDRCGRPCSAHLAAARPRVEVPVLGRPCRGLRLLTAGVAVAAAAAHRGPGRGPYPSRVRHRCSSAPRRSQAFPPCGLRHQQRPLCEPASAWKLGRLRQDHKLGEPWHPRELPLVGGRTPGDQEDRFLHLR